MNEIEIEKLAQAIARHLAPYIISKNMTSDFKHDLFSQIATSFEAIADTMRRDS